jgi:hypothetical protein
MMEALPSQFHEWIRDTADKLFQEWFVRDQQVEDNLFYLEEMGLTKPGRRKELAEKIKDMPPWLKHCLFAAVDRKNYTQTIFKEIKP